MRRFRFSLLTLLVLSLTAGALMFLNFRERRVPYVVVEHHDMKSSVGIGHGRVVRSLVRFKIAHRIHRNYSGFPFEVISYSSNVAIEMRVPNWEAAFAQVPVPLTAPEWDFDNPTPEVEFLREWPQAKDKILNDDWPDLAEPETHLQSLALNILVGVTTLATVALLTEFAVRRSRRTLAAAPPLLASTT